jgi:hypothetical protein
MPNIAAFDTCPGETPGSLVSSGTTPTNSPSAISVTDAAASGATSTAPLVSESPTSASADGNVAPDADASFWPWVGLGIGLCCLLLLIVLVVFLLRRRKGKKEDLGDHSLSRVSGTPAVGTMGAGRQSEYASTAAYLQEDEDKSVVYALMPQNTESNRSLPDKVVYASFPETQPISEVTYAYGMLE